jgi:1-deoxy-D-xylulose-5-phosphate synthase
VDGHDVLALTSRLAKENEATGTRVLHVKTRKKPLSQWRAALGSRQSTVSSQQSAIGNRQSAITKPYQDFFAEKLIALATADDRIVAITPAMLSGSSLTTFQAVFPQRTFDVGIAEQHAVTFAAGLAASGQKPLVHLYSTFAQRAYDQIIHDVALQNLHVVFAIDRAGLVGEDGATHHGAFDLSFLNPIPNLQILAPMDAAELQGMLAYAFTQDGPVALRYPRGGEVPKPTVEPVITKGSFRVLRQGTHVCVVSLGTIGQEVEKALNQLNAPSFSHIDLRFLKPWHDADLRAALAPYHTVVTAEDGSTRGGLRDTLAAWLATNLPEKKLVGLGLPDAFIPHGHPNELSNVLGLGSGEIDGFLQAFIA